MNRQVLALADVCTARPERAAQILNTMSKCPHAVLLRPVREQPNRIMCVYILPEHKVWWIMLLEEKPSLIGATSVTVTLLDQGHPQSLVMPVCTPEGEPPCGSDCGHCPYYRVQCEGCPASSFFVERSRQQEA